MSLPPVSKEQQHILDQVEKGHHVQIDAVAGSGKTTTSLWIAHHHPDKKILLLTYNARLKMETRQKASSFTHLEVHSYHAFCVQHWDPKAFTDAGILRYLDNHTTPPQSLDYSMLIIDEAQDMTPLYYRIVRCIVSACSSPPQLIIMGDRKQSIYGFNRADPRFLTLAPHLFGGLSQWKRATLSTSYRITRPMASFLNECCDGALPIQATKDGGRVRYIACSMYSKRPLQEVEYYLKKGFAYDDLFVLAPSVKCSQSPVRILANRLTEKGIPVYVPTTDDEKIADEVVRHKMVFSTFHQVKGLERAVVLVFDFSEHYFRYYGKDLDPFEIPNTLYVALTRARVGLTVFHEDTSPYASFLKRDKIEECCWVEKSKRFREDRILSVGSRTTKTASFKIKELLRYLPVDVVQECMLGLSITKIDEGSGSGSDSVRMEIPSVVEQSDGPPENVSEINAVAIPWYFEYQRTGTMPYASQDRLLSASANPIETLLRKSTERVCQTSGYQFKNCQIRRFDWLTPAVLEEASQRLSRCVDKKSVLQFQKEIQMGELSGTVPLWEMGKQRAHHIVYSTEARDEQFLEAALNAWLLGQNTCFLLVLVHEARYEIAWKNDPLPTIHKLLAHQQAWSEKKSDGDFVKSVKLMGKKKIF
jgi:hypothetical protein